MTVKNKNQFPIFVPTKGRFKTPYTIRALQHVKADFKIVIEKQEFNEYRQVVPESQILVVPHQNEGVTKTRNWIWDYAQSELGTPYYWSMDDNITEFLRLTNNIKFRVDSGAFLAALEDFAQRYENLYICGMNYRMFASQNHHKPPISFNTRIYSNMLIKTNIPYRFDLFFNEDTDICLRILKDGHCTAQFNAFLINKLTTMTLKGGNTEYYKKLNNRLEFAQMLQRAHPDCVQVVQKFGRWHHEVNYRPFKKNKLIRRKGIEIPTGVNNYGMKLVEPKTSQVT